MSGRKYFVVNGKKFLTQEEAERYAAELLQQHVLEQYLEVIRNSKLADGLKLQLLQTGLLV